MSPKQIPAKMSPKQPETDEATQAPAARSSALSASPPSASPPPSSRMTPSSPTSLKDASAFAPGDQDDNPEINRNSLDLFTASPSQIQESKIVWKSFCARYNSREAAGEAIFQALVEAAPSLQALFSTSRAVQAMKFMVAMHELIVSMDKPEALKSFVETLGLQSFEFTSEHLDMNCAKVVIFRDVLLDVVAFELGEDFSPEAKTCLYGLLSYAGGGIIYVRTHYAQRLRILTESWKYCKEKAQKGTVVEVAKEAQTNDENQNGSSMEKENVVQALKAVQHKKQGTVGKMWSKIRGKKSHQDHNGEDNGEIHISTTNSSKRANQAEKSMPTTFEDMFAVNSAVMGIKNNSWMSEVLESFDTLVTNVANSARVEEESDVLALRLSKLELESMNLDQFKACMLAALRSMLPKSWSGDHEVAWTWMWDNVARMLRAIIGDLAGHETSLEAFLEDMDEARLYDMRKSTYERFFELAPAGQYYFKQSNTRLHFINERIQGMVLELFKEPKRMVAEFSALGLRHVEFGIPTDLFAPFVSASVEVMGSLTSDERALAGYRWSMGLISRILVRTINEGSTLVMKAINANNIKDMRKAIDSAPRRDRAAWLLDIQVGTQSISPLSWAIESGSLDVAKAVLKDLLVIRSDRENYYFGAELLFSRHPDIVRRLVEDAPMILTTLLDGLIWRSHRHENGQRRVNYYIKYLLVNEAGEFTDALKWLAATGEPQTIIHPLVSTVSDTLWSGVVYRQFVVDKIWNVLSLFIFMLSQGILPRQITIDTEVDERKRILICILVGRIFSYGINMTRLAMFHLAKIWTWCRTTMKRIFDEIDEDGSGSIDWEEFKSAIVLFKSSIKDEFFKAFAFLRDDDGPAMMEDDKKVAASSANMYTVLSFLLMVLLAIMLSHEPMLWCVHDENWPTTDCTEGAPFLYRYSILATISLIIHWLILVDLAVFSTEISAFLLVCSHVMGEVKTFLTALTFLLLTFGSSMPVYCEKCPDVAGQYENVPKAMVSLFAITLGWFEADDVMSIRDSDQMFLVVLMVFVGLAVIILLNLLIAQLNRSYEYIYQDMLGFARLNRASLIVEAMFACPKLRWQRFRKGLALDVNLEFDAGDLGLAGGIQVLEPQSRNSVLHDTIHRFGGSTSPEAPWPEERDVGEDQDDRYDRMQQLLLKAYKRMTAATKRAMVSGGSGGHDDDSDDLEDMLAGSRQVSRQVSQTL